MDAFQFGYGSPGQYADWTKYAGLDRKTGMVGVAPPDQSSGNLVDNVSGAISELQQGNFMNAMKTFQYGKKPGGIGLPAIGAPAAQPVVDPGTFQYSHQWDD